MVNAATPNPTGPLLCLVRALIELGTALANTLRQGASDDTIAIVTRRFGVPDVAVIIARIVRALQLAAALEARLISGIAPWQLVPGTIRLPSPRAPRAGQSARQGAGGVEARLDRMPTAAQIAAEVRRRPAGGVIAELIRDFGIMPCHPLWRELSEAVMFNGGSLAALYNHINTRGMIAIGNPAFLPHPMPDESAGELVVLPGAEALPAGWMPVISISFARGIAALLPPPAASGAGPP